MKEWLTKARLWLLPCEENQYRPQFLEGNILFSILIAFFVLRVVFLPFYLGFSKSLFFAEIVSSDIVTLLNKQRVEEGLNSLNVSPQLTEAARLKAGDMLEEDYFAHNSPDGKTPWYFIKKAGYRYNVAGENLAIGFLDSSEVHEAWNNSPLHKRNLLDERFEEVGIAVLNGEYNGGRTTVVVEMFGRPIVVSTEPVLEPEESSITEETSDIEEAVAPAQEEIPEPVIEPVSEPVDEPAPVIESEPIDQGEPDGVFEERRFRVIGGQELIPTIEFNMIKFFISSYDQLVQNTIFLASGVLMGVLLLDLSLIALSSLEKEAKMLRIQSFALKGVVSILALIFLGSLSKTFIIQFLPHSIEI